MMGTLCRAGRKWQENFGQGNKTERVRGSHSPANHSSAPFFCPIHLSAIFMFLAFSIQHLAFPCTGRHWHDPVHTMQAAKTHLPAEADGAFNATRLVLLRS